MNLNIVSETIEWLEHRTRWLFVAVALVLYAVELWILAGEYSPFRQLDEFLIGALAALSVPFGVILLQELLELVSAMSESNLLSARHQFEIVVLVIVRSFFKKFAKLSDYVGRGDFGEPVQEALVKIGAIVLLGIMIYLFRRLCESDYIRSYVSSRSVNLVKQLLVVILIIFVLGYMLFVQGSFDEIELIRLVFTGVIIIDAIFLLLAIVHDSSFASIAFESSLIIALIFARFPLFTSNMLSYTLSVVGVMFATISLYVLYRVANESDFLAEDMAEHEASEHTAVS